MAPRMRDRASGPAGSTGDRRFGARTLAMGLLVVVVLGAGCSDSGSETPATTATTPTTRATSTSSTAPDPGPGPTSIDTRVVTTTVVDGLRSPTAMAPRPGTRELWVTEQDGRVRRVEPTRDSGSSNTSGRSGSLDHELDPDPLLDLGGLTQARGERGLLGIAFSSDGRRLYLHHTLPEGDVVVAEYRVPADDDPVDPGSRRVLLQIEHRDFANHNGGQLALGPDGFLYIGVGDGGGSGDPADRAQDPNQLLGKILRIDADGATLEQRYAVPSDNPFTAGGGAPEVYLYGARNPWRFSFDRATGDLWVADVGQNDVEEINYLPATFGSGRGANLGWNWFEGDEPFRGGGDPPEGLTEPLFTYRNTGDDCSIIGGYLYRGSRIPGLQGVYLYGDYCGGEVRGLLARNGLVLEDEPLGPDLGQGLVSFGEDAAGELYVLTAAGSLLAIEAA